MAHCGKRARQRMIGGHGVRHVVGGNDTDVAFGGERNKRIIAPHVERVTVVPHFDEHTVAAEGVDHQLQRTTRRRRTRLVQRTRQWASVRTGEHETLPTHSLCERLQVEHGL